MGTDIHPIVQVRKGDGWGIVDIPAGDRYGNILNDRNYNLFAVLGDVRNGFGFAGVKTSSGFEPISSSRGLPEDAGFEMDKHFNIRCAQHSTGSREEDESIWDCNECHWFGDHSHSYVTLRELLDYDWDGKTTELTGVIPLRSKDWPGNVSYKEYRTTDRFLNEMPRSYSGDDVAGPGVVTVTEPIAQALLAIPVSEFDKTNYYVQIVRHVSVSYAVGPDFMDKALPWLRGLGEPDDVRIIFGFDS
jgi:hypothetical protein